MSKKIIGLDLGSTLSEVAVIEAGKPVVVVNEEGSRTTPSVVSLKDGERKVGASAKRAQVVNPTETISLVKRLMGLTYDEAKEFIDKVPYEVVNRDGMPRIVIEGKEYSPEEISSMIIGKMKKIAEDYLGEEVTDVVITVPAYFDEKARNSTKTAAEIAGLNVLRIIAEPTAALLSSNIDMEKGGKYMVADYGGQTLDFSVAEISDGMVEILASNGSVYNGGSDLDRELTNWVISEFKDEMGIDLSSDAQAVARISEAVEKAKIELSVASTTEVNLPYITVKDGNPVHLIKNITRAKFEQLIDPWIDKVIECAKTALQESKLSATELDGILLVGGSCRIPLVQQRLTETFNVTLIKSSNMDLAVAEGACIQANIIVGGEGAADILLLDVVPIGYGIETLGGMLTTLIPSNTTIPCRKEEVFSTAVDNQPSVDIKIYQGERPMASDNKEIGLFRLDGILPARRGVPRIKVVFDIDANGLLKVTAIDEGTKKEQHITIESKGSLSQEEIDRMREDAKAHEAEDKKRKEDAETLNKGDMMAFSAEQMIEENADKIDESDKTKVKEVVDKIKQAVGAKNADEVRNLEKEMESLMHSISSKLYSQTQPQQEPTVNADPQASTQNDETVEDATFEEV